MDQEYAFLDNRMIDNFLFNSLVEMGYAPTIEEVQDLSDIFFLMLQELQIIEPDDFEEERENWR